MEDKKLLIISSYIGEKPTGGVTMHVHRLMKRLEEANAGCYDVCDYKKESFIAQLPKIRKATVMHVHATNPILKLLYVLLGKVFHTKSIITVHGRYGVYGSWRDIVHRVVLKKCDVPVLINKESYEDVVKINKNAVYIPAFIPPIPEEEKLPEYVKSRVDKFREEGKPLFVTNASSRAYTDDGKEIYGIDFLIGFFGDHSEYRLIIQDPLGQYQALYEENLPQNVIIIAGKYSFCGMVELTDMVIRNTPIDGDSFSVKEALCYHKKVLASNAVSRPQGVFLFEYNNKASLENSINKALSFNSVIDYKDVDAIPEYYQLYKKVGIDLKV